MPNDTKKKDRYMKIVYKDEHDKACSVVQKLEGEWYRSTMSVKENVETAASIVMIDDGVFWINSTTLLSANRIVSFQIHNAKEKNDKPSLKKTRRVPSKRSIQKRNAVKKSEKPSQEPTRNEGKPDEAN